MIHSLDPQMTLQGKRRHLEPRDPAFGSRLQYPHRLGVEIEPHGSVQKQRGLFIREAQIFQTDFSDAIERPPAWQRQPRLFTGGDDQPQLSR